MKLLLAIKIQVKTLKTSFKYFNDFLLFLNICLTLLLVPFELWSSDLISLMGANLVLEFVPNCKDGRDKLILYGSKLFCVSVLS